jgi:hypothetical protein
MVEKFKDVFHKIHEVRKTPFWKTLICDEVFGFLGALY